METDASSCHSLDLPWYSQQGHTFPWCSHPVAELDGGYQTWPITAWAWILPMGSICSKTSEQPGQNFLRNTLQSATPDTQPFLSSLLSQVLNLHLYLKALPTDSCPSSFTLHWHLSPKSQSYVIPCGPWLLKRPELTQWEYTAVINLLMQYYCCLVTAHPTAQQPLLTALGSQSVAEPRHDLTFLFKIHIPCQFISVGVFTH